MSKKRIFLYVTVFSLRALWPSAGSAVGIPEMIQSPTGVGLTLVERGEEVVVVAPNGERARVDAPRGTRFSDFHELVDGWVAAGVRWTGDSREIVLIRNSRNKTVVLPAPGVTEFRHRLSPAVLVREGRIIGLSWLEGDGSENNAVAVASWQNGKWEKTEIVSGVSEKTQIGLSGTVLDDGTKVLVWAAGVSADDDILWVRSTESGWSDPQLVHEDNDNPDIVPRVTSHESSAVVAWSQKTGIDYRLKLARLAGPEWRELDFVGEKGSLFPSFRSTEDGLMLLYSSVLPSAWNALRLEGSGRIVGRARLRRRENPRPLLLEDMHGFIWAELDETGTLRSAGEIKWVQEQ